jgi:hypothetical protein
MCGYSKKDVLVFEEECATISRGMLVSSLMIYLNNFFESNKMIEKNSETSLFQINLLRKCFSVREMCLCIREMCSYIQKWFFIFILFIL